jgi:hypothetical protein
MEFGHLLLDADIHSRIRCTRHCCIDDVIFSILKNRTAHTSPEGHKARRAPSARQPPFDIASGGKRGVAVVIMIWARRTLFAIK